MPGQPAHELVWPLVQQFFDGFALERSVGDNAGMVIAVAQDPSFSKRAISRQWSGENVGQTPTAPEPILVDRFESKGI